MTVADLSLFQVLKKFENDAGRYLICGTNAFKPECREYVEDAGSYLMTKKSKGVGLCPYSPDHNSTSVLVQDKLYAGTAADYQVGLMGAEICFLSLSGNI